MQPGSLGSNWKDRVPPMAPWGGKTLEYEHETSGSGKGPMAARMFGNGAIEYAQKYGSTTEHLAKIGACFFLVFHRF